MDAGYIQDIGDNAQVIQISWVSGTPEERKFLGRDTGLIKYRPDGIPMVANRCPKCAFVEWYAPVDTLPINSSKSQ